MRTIMFYPASNKFTPHWGEDGALHLSIEEFTKVIASKGKVTFGDKYNIPEYMPFYGPPKPTNGTVQDKQD